MKMIYVTCNVSVRESLIKMLEENDIKDYQVIEQLTAKNILGEPRFNNAIWPGYNSAVLMQFSNDEHAKKIIQKIKDFNQQAFNENELVTACSWTIDEYFYQ